MNLHDNQNPLNEDTVRIISAPSPKKKLNIYAITAIIAGSAIALGGIALYIIIILSPPGRGIDKSDWKTGRINGMSLQLPFEVVKTDMEMTEELKSCGVKSAVAYVYESSSFNFTVHHFEYEAEGSVNIDGEAEGTLQGEYNGLSSAGTVEDFKYNVEYTFKENAQARLIRARYILNGAKCESYGALYVQGKNLWITQCIFLNSGTNHKKAEEIIKSVKIQGGSK